ncbi:response regulator transcription factor [Altererythrobacter sp. SALINAS58]|uniref:response regulator transcription factor n=1 Tax=Alteripontixanthobacter muriae TaxID=2705546 RepID=UPI001575BDB5|nr:response regulator transcription factor [Alteripontixanthobacter muriae]NTZ42644.1 response regulator transcription factor [Alteripontixanthobacter muriae]
MIDQAAIMLLVDDASVLAALQFSLSVEGFDVVVRAEGQRPESAAAALVIDERYSGNGLEALEELRALGCTSPAFILVTNPNSRLHDRIAAQGAILIEKPLFGDELSSALRGAVEWQRAA